MLPLPSLERAAVDQRTIEKLNARVAELVQQVASLELLAEALRDERDTLHARVESTAPVTVPPPSVPAGPDEHDATQVT